jgi:hypothetical protein
MSIVGPIAPLETPHGSAVTWSTPLDVQLRDAYLLFCRGGHATTTDHGQALEQLAVWLFAHVQGLTIQSRNQFSLDGSQEIDVVLFNSNIANPEVGFPMESDTVLLVECKNWSKKADSSDVAWFDWKMRLGGVRHGVMLSAQGITGHARRRSAAHGILMSALREGRFIYIVTLDDLENVACAADIRNMIIGKRVQLAAGNPFG